jgi:hypothetical protein
MADPITPEQIRAARALLDWSPTNLATAVRLSRTTIDSAERTGASDGALLLIRATLEEAGVEFLETPAVTLRKR